MGCEIDPELYSVGQDVKEQANTNKYHFALNYIQKEIGCIEHPIGNSSSEVFILTELGREIKEKKGFNNWKMFKNGVESVPFENIKWMKATAEATRDAADSAKISATFSKRTFNLIFAYTILTAILVIIGIFTCNYQRNQNNQTKTTNSNTDTKLSKPTDIHK